jgi:hypothetical protein
MRFKVFARLVAVIGFLAAGLQFTAIHGTAADLNLVHVGYGGIAGYQLPLWINKDNGISKKYGNILREMGAPQRNPNEFIDMSLLDEIEKEGFLQKLR